MNKRKLITQLMTIKMYWNRANSHLSMPINVYEKVMLLVILLKMFNIFSWWLMGITAFILTFGFIFIGWLDVEKGVFKIEQSINNKHNPELMKIVRRKNYDRK